MLPESFAAGMKTCVFLSVPYHHHNSDVTKKLFIDSQKPMNSFGCIHTENIFREQFFYIH